MEPPVNIVDPETGFVPWNPDRSETIQDLTSPSSCVFDQCSCTSYTCLGFWLASNVFSAIVLLVMMYSSSKPMAAAVTTFNKYFLWIAVAFLALSVSSTVYLFVTDSELASFVAFISQTIVINMWPIYFIQHDTSVDRLFRSTVCFLFAVVALTLDYYIFVFSPLSSEAAHYTVLIIPNYPNYPNNP
jgi:hypothetical protein